VSDFLLGRKQGLVPPPVKWYHLADAGAAVRASFQASFTPAKKQPSHKEPYFWKEQKVK